MAVARFDVGRIGNQQVETVFSDSLSMSNHEPQAKDTSAPLSAAFCRATASAAGLMSLASTEASGAFAGQRYGHCAAACAQIPYAPLRRQVLQCRFYQMLGFGAGNQGGGRGAETAAVNSRQPRM